MMDSCLLGLDIGSSSIKASLLNASSGTPIASAFSPKTELPIQAPKPGWAEQDPEEWWKNVHAAIEEIRTKAPRQLEKIQAVGISYQMHGLVLIDRKGSVLRNAIIWCDSRAVPYGEKAFRELGETHCLKHLLNSPGNFTASKLAWVKDQEPELFRSIDKILLPGDYIAYRLTREITTTPSGLSEGILWDMKEDRVADFLLQYFGFPRNLIPTVVPTFSIQGRVTVDAAKELGIPPGIPVAYRAGDQPNNAFSLGVLEPGELAATAGTSGVVYGILDHPAYDPLSRVNTFLHVNHLPAKPRLGVLLCLNGTGILYRWLKQNTAELGPHGYSYAEMNEQAAKAPPGSEGLIILPYGNGAERTLENQEPGARIQNLNFNLHQREHLWRAAQEGIVFALNYGLEIMQTLGIKIQTVKAGHTNMFLSPLFRSVFTAVTGAELFLYETDGAEGAARGAGIGAGLFRSTTEAFHGLQLKTSEKAEPEMISRYGEVYATWKAHLEKALS
ncbi:MAG TPA: FGGY family carbohydrate kinase [Spirochaetales bacterium]|nr:FGGY family carbohydrate kinase [Spirochaetales bacterium]